MSHEPQPRTSVPQATVTVSPSRDAVFDALADTRRRILLALLQEQQRPISVCELAAEIAARESDERVEDVDEEHRRRVLTDLHHNQLPRLTQTNLVLHDRDRRSVSIAARSLFEHDVAEIIRSCERGEPADDIVFECLADRRRRQIVAVLDETDQSMPLSSLAGKVADQLDETDETSIERVQTSLYHVDLPKLADAGLVDYDADRQLASGRELPSWYQT